MCSGGPRGEGGEDGVEGKGCGAPGVADDQTSDLAGGAAFGFEAEESAEGGGAGLTWGCEEEGGIGPEELPTPFEEGLSDAVAEEAVSADADEAVREDVLEEEAAERGGVEPSVLEAVAITPVAVLEADGVTVVGEEAVVGDGDFADVPGEVVDDLLGTAEGATDVDLPLSAGGVAEALVAGIAGDGEHLLAEEGLELGEELSLEDGAEDLEGEEVTPAVEEAIGTESPAGDEAVKVGVGSEELVPGVEDGEDSWTEAEGGRRLQDGLGDGGEQGVEGMGPSRSLEESLEGNGEGEDEVEVGDRQEVRDLGLGPESLVEATAARAVPVATGVVGVVDGAAAVADGAVPAQAAGTAGEDVGDRLGLVVVETEAPHVIAEDVGDRGGLFAAGHATSWGTPLERCVRRMKDRAGQSRG